jgi:erythromycin esterase
MRRRWVLFLLLWVLCTRASSQTTVGPRVAWLEKHAVRLRSIEPCDEDFADLEPLVSLIGDARIVQLGEQSHGDGASFHAKTRLIEFLHQRMGFDVLAFESGLYDCRKAWERFRAGDDPLAAAQQGIFGIWTQSFEVRPLLEYLSRTARTPRPLELCGFDCQLTARGSRDSLLAELGAFLAATDPGLIETDTWKVARETVQGLMSNEHRFSAPQRKSGRAALEAFRESLASPSVARVHSPRDAAFWRQMLTSLTEQLEVHWSRQEKAERRAEDNNRRDAQMARNLIWLADSHYPDRKIIVWAATFHIMRNAPNLTRIVGGGTYEQTVPMGHPVREHFGERVYTLGFAAYEGERGRPWTAAYPLAPPGKDTFEDLCARAGLENAVVDFRSAGKDGEWLRRPLVARPLGYSPMRGDWTTVLDGMVFTRRMTPTTRTGTPVRREREEPQPMPTSLVEVVERHWKQIEEGHASGSYWVDKWDFARSYQAWKDETKPDEQVLAVQERAVSRWFDEHEKEENLAWRAHALLSEMAKDRNDPAGASKRLDRAIAAYPDREYAEPAKQSKFQHLVNARAMLLWDEKGREAAVEYAARLLGEDRRFHFLFLHAWTARLAEEGASAAIDEIAGRFREAYSARAKKYPECAEEAARFAAMLP